MLKFLLCTCMKRTFLEANLLVFSFLSVSIILLLRLDFSGKLYFLYDVIILHEKEEATFLARQYFHKKNKEYPSFSNLVLGNQSARPQRYPTHPFVPGVLFWELSWNHTSVDFTLIYLLSFHRFSLSVL